MRKSNENEDVLIRFAKYGKWKLLDFYIEDDAEMTQSILKKFPEKDFIAMKIGETEAVIKRTHAEN